MSNEKNLSKLYFEHIVGALNVGHAAVMVGSGFSKNASRVDKSENKFPDWPELANTFVNKLGLDREDVKYANPLNLAQQVEVLYGKPYLNDLIRHTLEDESYEPGLAHKLLIQLPWNDVFTTNYDTLLERAFQSGTTRRYRVIYNQQDLLYSAGEHRIIKLHGSFPSYEPFIISEEDFRCYPSTYAPFVNTVQQSLLENTFVLLGFSGDDPNFLNWIGWIHDNLGLKNSPRIYLVSKSGETEVKTKMLASRNIDVLVLDDIVNKEFDYNKAIEEFLKKLNDSTENNRTKTIWPGRIARLFNREAQDVYLEVKRIHDSYPGWLMAKKNSLKDLIYIIKDICLCISNISKEDKREFELELCEELSWFCDISGTSIDSNIVSTLKEILSRNKERNKDIPYIRIQLLVLRALRIMGDDEWAVIYQDLSLKLKNHGIWNEEYTRLCYENAMEMLYSYNWDTLEEAVRLIPTNFGYGEWNLRKAGLLAMLGKYEDSLNLITEASEYTRKVLIKTDRSNEKTYNRFSSLENCLITLYYYVKQAFKNSTGNISESYANVFDEKKKDSNRLCNSDSNSENEESNDKIEELRETIKYDLENNFVWENENESYVSDFTEEYQIRLSDEEVPTFYIGRISRISHFNDDFEPLTAMQFLAFRENTGIPVRIGSVVYKKGVIGAISRIMWKRPYTASLYTILSGDKKIVEKTFSRMGLSQITEEKINTSVEKYVKLFKSGMNSECIRNKTSVWDTVLQEYVLNILPEILSRLCVLCDTKHLKLIANLIVDLYLWNEASYYTNVSVLVRNLIDSFSFEKLKETLPVFWNIDIRKADPSIKSYFPDPFKYIYLRFAGENEKLQLGEDQIKKFYEIIALALNPDFKETAVSRLCYIDSLYSLDEKQEKQFRSIIWAVENLDEFGLPNLGEFFKVNAIDYVNDEERDNIITACKKNIYDQFEKSISGNYLSTKTDLFNMTMNLLTRIYLTEDEASKACNLGRRFCEYITRNETMPILFGSKQISDWLNHIDEILGTVILRGRVAGEGKYFVNEDLSFIVELLDNGGYPHSLISWCINSENRYDAIVTSIFNSDPIFSHNANMAIYQLLDNGIQINDKVKKMMINSVVSALHYNVNTYLLGVEHLVRKGILQKDECDLLSRSLLKFDKMTKMDKIDQEDVVMQKLWMRKTVSVLAHTLYEWYKQANLDIPNEIDHWKKISENKEEFSEIRLAWDKDIVIKE